MWRGQHGRLMFPRFTMTGGVWRVAEKLGINQENVSRLEQRTDLLISTLSSYVEAMGGKLSLVAEFPDRPPVTLTGIAALGDLLERPAES